MKKQRIAQGIALIPFLLAATVAWCGDNGNGTVTANGLVWLKDASCLGKKDWNSANSSTQSLSATNAPAACNLKDGSTSGQWRLPNSAELSSVAGSSSGQFNNVQYASYWSSSTSSLPGYYTVISVKTATVGAAPKSNPQYFLAVRNL